MKIVKDDTYTVKIYMSGPVEVAKQIIREECLTAGLCVTIEPTTYIYTGGEETGYVVGLLNYPRFPTSPDQLLARARILAIKLLDGTFQHSALIVTPTMSEWYTMREHYDNYQPIEQKTHISVVPEGWEESLNTALVIETERAIKQRDEYLRTGVVTAGNGGSHDTCFAAIIRRYITQLNKMDKE